MTTEKPLTTDELLASLPGIRAVGNVTFDELMVPLSAIREALVARPDTEALASVLHDRYAAIACLGSADMHDYAGCDVKDQWREDAAALRDRL